MLWLTRAQNFGKEAILKISGGSDDKQVILKQQKMASEEEEEARYRAMVEFIGSFPTVSSPPVDISEMADGVAIFEALSEM